MLNPSGIHPRALQVLAAFALIGLGAPLSAGSETATMHVSVEILPSCGVATEPMVFPSSEAKDSPLSSQSEIRIRCSAVDQFSITIDGGRSSVGGVRSLINSSGDKGVTYRLFADADLSEAWQPNVARTFQNNETDGTKVRVFGRAETVRSDIRPGLYTDELVISIHF